MSNMSVMPSNLLSSVVPFSSHLQSFPASGSFPMSQFFTSGGQSTGVSASALVLPMNTQDLFPLGWTSWISLLSKGLSRVFSNTTVQKHSLYQDVLPVLPSPPRAMKSSASEPYHFTPGTIHAPHFAWVGVLFASCVVNKLAPKLHSLYQLQKSESSKRGPSCLLAAQPRVTLRPHGL